MHSAYVNDTSVFTPTVIASVVLPDIAQPGISLVNAQDRHQNIENRATLDANRDGCACRDASISAPACFNLHLTPSSSSQPVSRTVTSPPCGLMASCRHTTPPPPPAIPSGYTPPPACAPSTRGQTPWPLTRLTSIHRSLCSNTQARRGESQQQQQQQ